MTTHAGYPMSEDKDKDKDLIALAHKQFQSCVNAEQENREYMLDDLRFLAASPDNSYQWPDTIRMRRESDPSGQRPCLTINKLPQHTRQVTNDIRQNRPSIRILPVDDDSDPEVAEVLNGIIRHIQYVSGSDVAYDHAAEMAVAIGIGYIRVLTDYLDDDTFDQEILIKRIKNPFSVYMDPAIQEPDGSDARFVFVTETLSEEEFKAQYPKAEPIDWDFIGKGDNVATWFHDKTIRVAEWWRVEETDDKIHLLPDGSKVYDKDLPEGVMPIKSRDIKRRKVMCRKINGQQVLEEYEWAGKFIPIARVPGNEYEIDGKQVISGLVRNAKDAQRMYNYMASAEVEAIGLAPKAPFIAAAGQIEGYESQWNTSNTVNHAVIEYNPVVDTDMGPMQMPPPQRSLPPMPNSAVVQAKMGASDDLKATTGQYDASLGSRGNETSGRAILARQREGDTGTYHYVDNLSRAIRFIGRIIIDLIPKIYDTQRVARILGEDGEPDMARLDPESPMAVREYQDEQGAIKKIYNPTIGRYDVDVTTGPSYNTKRQEAAEAMVQMTQANPQLWQVIGDLLVKNMDWPGADDMAERLKATLIPPVQALIKKDEDSAPQIPPEVQQDIQMAMQHMQELQAQLQQAQAELDKAKSGDEWKEKEIQIKAMEVMINHYKAETDRIKVMQAAIPAQEQAELGEQVAESSMHSPSEPEPAYPEIDESPEMEAIEQPAEPAGAENGA